MKTSSESIWNNFVKLVRYWKTLPRRKQPDKGDLTLQEAVEDSLMKAKFKLFEMVARHFNSFLEYYQTAHLMVPFLCNYLTFLYRNLVTRFIRSLR